MQFHERFNIPLNVEDAQKRFINRVQNRIVDVVDNIPDEHQDPLTNRLANSFGRRLSNFDRGFRDYIPDDFYGLLHAIEIIYAFCLDMGSHQDYITLANHIAMDIPKIIKESEVDLAIEWQFGKFVSVGAKLLDEKLVNEPLKWLSERKYENVLFPFKKGISHFIESEKRAELLSDVVTDMYEALEALAKIITEKDDRDLSANSELFISRSRISDKYRPVLKTYIVYANDFRHAAKPGETKLKIDRKEVESFIYLTGLFIRMVISN